MQPLEDNAQTSQYLTFFLAGEEYGPGPSRVLMRLPHTLATTVPTPIAVKLSPTACSESPSVRAANRICTVAAAWCAICQAPITSASATSLAGRGRVLVRYSGTELLARVMLAGEDEKQIRAMAQDIGNEIRAEVGK